MNSTPQKGFVHSTPVPRIYKIASKVAKNVREGKDSLKNLVYAERHVNIKALYALVVEAFKRNDIIDDLIKKSELLVKEPRFDVWLAKILISELLWGKNKMTRGCKPVETILSYEEILRTLLKDCVGSVQPVLKHNIAKPRYVRINTLKITVEEAVENFRQEGWIFVPFFNKSDYGGFQSRLNLLKPDEFMKDIHIPELLIFPPKTEFYQHEAYKSGCVILQDKASCLPVHLLAPPPGSIVLDTCAAPGMKTTQLAALLQNKGIVYAVELNPKRASLLRELVESVGATCIKTILKDVMQVTADDCPDIEYILVDPSCSGSGITDRIEIEKLDLSARIERLNKLCNFQAKLLRYTMTAFPKAKRIVYSTCSMNSDENEDVVRQTLETSRQFKLIDAKKLLQSWNTKTSELYPELGNMCIYATPEEDKTNGFFVAVFERMEDGEKNPFLNYQLCKFFDKKTRKNKSHDDIEESDVFEMTTENDNSGNLLSSNNYQKELNNNPFERKKKMREFPEESHFNTKNNRKCKIRGQNDHRIESSDNNCENQNCLPKGYSPLKSKNIENSYFDEERPLMDECNSNIISHKEKKRKKIENILNEPHLENSDEVDHLSIRKQRKHKKVHVEEREKAELHIENLSNEKKNKHKSKRSRGTEESESIPYEEKCHRAEDSEGVSPVISKEKKKHKKSKDHETKPFQEVSADDNDLSKGKKLKRKICSEDKISEIATEKFMTDEFDIVPSKKEKKKKKSNIVNEDNGSENSTIYPQTNETEQKKSIKIVDEADTLNNFRQDENEAISELERSNEEKIKKKKKKHRDDNETISGGHDNSGLNREVKKIKKHEHSVESCLDENKVISELEGSNEEKIKKKKKKKPRDHNETVSSEHDNSGLNGEVKKIKKHQKPSDGKTVF